MIDIEIDKSGITDEENSAVRSALAIDIGILTKFIQATDHPTGATVVRVRVEPGAYADSFRYAWRFGQYVKVEEYGGEEEEASKGEFMPLSSETILVHEQLLYLHNQARVSRASR